MSKISEELQTLNEKMTEVSQKLQKIGFLLVQLLNRLPEKGEKTESAAIDAASFELMVNDALSKFLEKKLPGILQREIHSQIGGITEKITAIHEVINKFPKMDASLINPLQEKLLPLLTEIKTHNNEVMRNIEQHTLDISNELKKLTSGKIKEAEEITKRTTNLLEKGLALVELESLLREIKSYLEEFLMGKELANSEI